MRVRNSPKDNWANLVQNIREQLVVPTVNGSAPHFGLTEENTWGLKWWLAITSNWEDYK